MPLCPGKISFLTRWIDMKLSPGFEIHLNPSKNHGNQKCLAAGHPDTSSIFSLYLVSEIFTEINLSLSLSSNLQAKFKKETFCFRILSSHLPPPCLPIQKAISTTAIPSIPLKPCCVNRTVQFFLVYILRKTTKTASFRTDSWIEKNGRGGT